MSNVCLSGIGIVFFLFLRTKFHPGFRGKNRIGSQFNLVAMEMSCGLNTESRRERKEKKLGEREKVKVGKRGKRNDDGKRKRSRIRNN